MNIDINQLDTAFTEDTEPQDMHLMELLKQAYKGEILCTMAVSKIHNIKPFSDYMPNISEAYENHFKQSLVQKGVPPALYVYAQDGKLIMSDDYQAYYMYQKLGMENVRCVVIGDTPAIEDVTYVGEPFKLQPPTIEAL